MGIGRSTRTETRSLVGRGQARTLRVTAVGSSGCWGVQHPMDPISQRGPVSHAVGRIQKLPLTERQPVQPLRPRANQRAKRGFSSPRSVSNRHAVLIWAFQSIVCHNTNHRHSSKEPPTRAAVCASRAVQEQGHLPSPSSPVSLPSWFPAVLISSPLSSRVDSKLR